MTRLLNLCVIALLVAAAAYVYKIKFESTREAQRLAKLRMEISREHDAIATLRAEWAKLDNPGRIQTLAQRHLSIRTLDPKQYSALDRLPPRPPELVPDDTNDPIAFLIEKPESTEVPTAGVKARERKK